MKENSWIEKLQEKSLRGESFSRDEFLSMLAVAPDSEEAARLGRAAREVAAAVTGNKARIWAAIGVDYMPCPVNCEFCSFGEKWGIVKEPYAWQDEEVIAMARHFLQRGAKWITLRSTEYFPPERLVDMARKFRQDLPGDYGIVVNTGELAPETAAMFKENGINVVYHSLRLREGDQSGITPEYRLKTLASVRDSPLALAFLVEPVGVEHTDDELADVFFTAMEYNAALTGAMARVPVPGTPLGDRYPVLPEPRLAQLVAAIRLAAGWKAPDICVHPPVKQALAWGANVCVVEAGAVPRDTGHYRQEWQVFTVETASEWFEECGYELDWGLKR